MKSKKIARKLSKRRVVKKKQLKKKSKNLKNSRLAKHSSFLKTLLRTKRKQKRIELVDKASKPEILTITELFYNVLRQNIPLTSEQKQKLCKHKHALRLICSKQTNCEQKRELIKESEQEGGFLGILASVLPFIGSLISNIVGQ